MYDLAVPKLNSNDVSYVLTEWWYEDGDVVPAGAEVALVETSKAAEGLVCDEGGVLLREVEVGRECRPGQVVARLFRDPAERDAFLATGSDSAAEGAAVDGLVITEPARRLMEQYDVDPAALARSGRKVIGSADVRRLLDGRADPAASRRRHVPARGQRAVAELVTHAHRTIPAAHATVSVMIDAALAALREYSEAEGVPVRLPELLIRSVADQFGRHPLFFATVDDDGGATLADEARIGVTIDVGRGLTVPVVHGAALRSLDAIAETLARFRRTALRGRFTEADLAGANIGLSLPAGEVVLVRPLVLPGQVAMVWLGAPQTTPHLEPDGRLTARQTVHVGLVYDHRVVNGRDAAMFLGDVKGSLESPRRLRALVRPADGG